MDTNIIRGVLALVSALSGAGSTFFIKLNHKKLCSLISFSAGALLGAALFVLIPESAENLAAIEIIIGVLSGYLLFWFISKYFSHVCPACSASHFDEKTTHKFSEIVLTLITALSIHSLLDGMALSTGNNIHSQNESILAAILTHKFPEGLALAALMFSSSYPKQKIIIYVTLVESTTVIGTIIGTYLFQSGISPVITSAIMAHIAGGFIFLSLHAVLGEMLKNHTRLVIFSLSLGLILILGVHLIFS